MDAARSRQGGAGGSGGRKLGTLHPSIRPALSSVLLVCGRPGPVSVHTPDVCYAGVGYAMENPPVLYQPPSATPSGEFWMADFVQQKSTIPTHLRMSGMEPRGVLAVRPTCDRSLGAEGSFTGSM